MADKFLTELQSQLDEQQVVIDVDEEARLWLVEKGYDATMGARPMERVVQEHIKKPLADMVLFGSLVKGAPWSPSRQSETGLVIEAEIEAAEPVEAWRPDVAEVGIQLLVEQPGDTRSSRC